MGSLIVIFVVVAIAFVWLRGTRRNRDRWLSRLDLPGIWEWEDHDGVLEITGELSGGQYRFRESGGVEKGQWRLEGHSLMLARTGENQVQRYDLRFFDAGKIGVHGPGKERRVYIKIPSNVVPLHGSQVNK